MKKGKHYIETNNGDLLVVTLKQKELLYKAFIVYPDKSRTYLINRIRDTSNLFVDKAQLELFDFRLKLCKVTTIMPDEYMVDYFISVEEAEAKFPRISGIENIQMLPTEEFNEVNKNFLLVQKNKFYKGENITHL